VLRVNVPEVSHALRGPDPIPVAKRGCMTLAVVFNNNARDHALRNAERFGELLSAGKG
jgi:hypothetical protein